jgi:hypothetical protein
VPGETNLRLVTLDRTAGGRAVRSSVVELPERVQPAIEQSPNRAFVARVVPEAGAAAAVTWEFVDEPLRGVAPGPDEVLPGEEAEATAAGAIAESLAIGAAAPAPSIVTRGMARLDLGSGDVTPLVSPLEVLGGAPAGAVTGAAPGGPAPPPDAPQPAGPDGPFISADGRHEMRSERVANDPVWKKYRWTILERATGERVGAVRMPMHYAPFFVDGTHLVYETGPYLRQTEEGMVEEPLQIRAVELRTGRRLWSRQIRDTVDRNPPPP